MYERNLICTLVSIYRMAAMYVQSVIPLASRSAHQSHASQAPVSVRISGVVARIQQLITCFSAVNMSSIYSEHFQVCLHLGLPRTIFG